MKVDVVDGLPGVVPDVGDDPIAGLDDPIRPGHLRAELQQIGGEVRRHPRHLVDGGDMLSWNHEDVGGRRRLPISEGHRHLAFGDKLGLHFTGRDRAEDAVHSAPFPNATRDVRTRCERLPSMPELPEVETVRRTLGPHLLGRTILRVEVGSYLPVIGVHSPDEFSALLTGRVVVRLGRRGKYLMIDLDDRSGVIVHLRMTGALSVVDRDAPSLRFEQLRFLLDDGRDLRFTDQRKFGRVTYRLASDRRPLEAKLGPEPLSPRFSLDDFQGRLAGRTAPIKALILDQRIVAGVGNIYADEALFRARIHPRRPGGSLSEDEVARLRRAVRRSLRLGIEHRGTTFSSYRDADGNGGENQSRLLVYGRGRKGEPCPRCGGPLSLESVAQRSSHLCAQCQPFEHVIGHGRVVHSGTEVE